MEEIVRRQRRKKDIQFAYGEQEDLLMKYLTEHKIISLTQLRELTGLNPNYALGMHSLPEGSDDPLRGGSQTAIESLQLTKTLQTNVLSRLNPMTFQSGCDPRRHHLTMKITDLVVVCNE